MTNVYFQQLGRYFLMFRNWVDNPEEKSFGGTAAQSPGDNFFLEIMREIEAVIQKERLNYLSGECIIPTEYKICISEEDNLQWQGLKRKALKKGLMDFLFARIESLPQASSLMSNYVEIQLIPDSQLTDGEIKVLPVWDERKLNFIVRNKPNSSGETTYLSPKDEEETFIAKNLPRYEEATIIRKPEKPLYELEIWRKEFFCSRHQIYEPEIKIGRELNYSNVDICLAEDLEISRLHAILKFSPQNKPEIFVEGKNPVLINEITYHRAQSAIIDFGAKISIGFYTLVILQLNDCEITQNESS